LGYYIAWVFEVVVFPLLNHSKPTAEDSTILCNIGKTFYYYCNLYFSYVHEEPVLDIFPISLHCGDWRYWQETTTRWFFL